MISGPNQVETGSKSGRNQVQAEGFSWVGAGGVGLAGGVPVAPPESPYVRRQMMETFVVPHFMAGCPVNFRYAILFKIITQGRILAVWILAPKLPNSDLKIGVDFWGGFFPPVFSKKKARKNTPKESPVKFTQDFVQTNSPRISAEAFS